MSMHIVVVDDHPIVLDGTKNLLESVKDWQVTTISNCNNLIETIHTLAPDLLLLDINLGTENGAVIAQQLKEKMTLPIILYSGYDIEDYYGLLVAQKIDGLLSKTATKEVLIATIEAVLRGDIYIPRSFLNYISTQKSTLDELNFSQRDITILQLIAQGETNKAIASTLQVSQRTIESSLTKIFAKLNVDSRAQAVHQAKVLNLI